MTDTNVLEEAIKDFKRSVEITRDVRFQANLRLTGRQRGSSYVIALLSLYVIGLSLLPNIISLRPFQSQLLLACSIVLSVFVIFTSLIDGAQNFYHQGELLHQCARKIATIHHQLKNIDHIKDPDKAWSDLAGLQESYRNALDECPINHDNMDFYAEKYRKPHLFPGDYPKRWKFPLRLWYWINAQVLRYSWVSLHLVAFIVVSVVVYVFVIHGAKAIER